MHPVFVQAIYYAISWFILLFFIGFIIRGFFWKFIKVKLSFGRLILVKVRAINRDFFSIGEVKDGFLVYKAHKKNKRIAIKDSTVFYKSIGVLWVDVDEEKGALCKVDYSAIDGFDSEKFENLFVRTLYRPSISDNKEKIMFIMLGVCILLAVGGLYLAYNNGQGLQFLGQRVAELKEINKGIIIGSTVL